MRNIFSSNFNPEAIRLAFYHVPCWPDRMIKDRVGIRAFKAQLHKNCEQLPEKILQGRYKAHRGFRFYAPKPPKT